MAAVCKRPDEAALRRVLERFPYSPEGAILRLAWLEGLSRAEITHLLWEQVDFDEKLLTLDDRVIPLEDDAAVCLQKRHSLYARCSDHVVISDRGKQPMPPESVSRLARNALNSEGLDVSLMDLRHDFIIRQIEQNGWPTAARVSGMAVATLRDAFSPYLRTARKLPSGTETGRDERDYLLWRIIQQEGGSPVGLALWMAWRLQMQPGEIAALTWEQVDFEQNLIRLPDRSLSMGSRLRRMLLEAWDRRKDPAVPQVFTAPTTGQPMDPARLSTVTRTALIRGGLENVNLRTLHTWARQDAEQALLMARAEEAGYLTREDVMQLLGLSRNAARLRLLALREDGRLTRIGARYYPTGSVIPPEAQSDVIRAYVRDHGSARRQDILELLNVPPAQATHILKGLVERGELTLTGRHYTLPPDA